MVNESLAFPCRVYNKNVDTNDHAVQCDLCNFWIHIKCNNLNDVNYKYLQRLSDSWYCITCSSSRFPLNCLNNDAFSSLIIQNSYSSQPKTSCIEKKLALCCYKLNLNYAALQINLKLVSAIFYQMFIFSPNESPRRSENLRFLM